MTWSCSHLFFREAFRMVSCL